MTATPFNPKLGMLADRMAETLGQEVIAMSGVRDSLSALLTAVRRSQSENLGTAAENLQEFIHVAAERRSAFARQLDLFFRVAGASGETIADVLSVLGPAPEAAAARTALAGARQRIREIAMESGQLVAATDYALRCAGQINHELILLLHGLMQPDNGRVYTSRGTTAPPNRRSMLDRRG